MQKPAKPECLSPQNEEQEHIVSIELDHAVDELKLETEEFGIEQHEQEDELPDTSPECSQHSPSACNMQNPDMLLTILPASARHQSQHKSSQQVQQQQCVNSSTTTFRGRERGNNKLFAEEEAEVEEGEEGV